MTAPASNPAVDHTKHVDGMMIIQGVRWPCLTCWVERAGGYHNIDWKEYDRLKAEGMSQLANSYMRPGATKEKPPAEDNEPEDEAVPVDRVQYQSRNPTKWPWMPAFIQSAARTHISSSKRFFKRLQQTMEVMDKQANRIRETRRVAKQIVEVVQTHIQTKGKASGE